MYRFNLYFSFLFGVAWKSWALLPVQQRTILLNQQRRWCAKSCSLLAALSGPDNHVDSDMIRKEQEEEEYQKKLAEAKDAMQVVEETRQRRVGASKMTRPPNDHEPILVGAKVSRSDAGTLIIHLPPAGLDARSAFGGAFTIAWFSAVIPATLSGVGLFMVPFWVAGGLVAKQSLVDPLVGSELEIGKYAWSYSSRFAGRNIKRQEGATEDLLVARSEIALVVNGRPQYALTLYGSNQSTSFVLPMTMAEEDVEHLTSIINDHLQNVREAGNDDDLFLSR